MPPFAYLFVFRSGHVGLSKGSCLPGKTVVDFAEQPFNARQSLIAFKREMERLTAQALVVTVEEGNDWA